MKKIFTCLFVAHLLCFVSCSFLKIKQNNDQNSQNQKSENPESKQQYNGIQEKTSIVPKRSTATPERLSNAFCFINNNGTVYDLNDLRNDESDYKIKTVSGYVSFNFCRDAINSCPGRTGIASYSADLQGTDCVLLAGNNTISNNFFVINDEEKNSTVLRMRLPEGEKCQSDINQNYRTVIDFFCDEEAVSPVISNAPININTCKNRIYVASKSACPKHNVYALWNRIMDNRWIFGALLILAGIFFCFFGENFIKISQVVAGGALSLVFFLYFAFNHTGIQLYTWQFWLVIVIAVAFGCLIGYIMSYFIWLPGVVFGALLGFVLTFFIFNLCLRFIESNPTAVFWVTLVVCLVGGSLFGYFYQEEICIVSTSIVGAYAIVRGISFWCGGFPDERQVYELGQKGEWDQMHNLLTNEIYAYLAGFLILSAVGMIVQFKYFYDGDKNKNKEDEKEKSDYEDEKPFADEA